MKARKENKVYRIDEDSKKRYLEEGFDIYGDDGVLLEYSPKKKITYAEHCKVVTALKAEIEELTTEIEKQKPKKEAAPKKAGE